MIHYAISDVRFISHGITLHQSPKIGDKFAVLEINSNTIYCYSVCGFFPTPYGYQTELLPLFSPLKTSSNQ